MQVREEARSSAREECPNYWHAFNSRRECNTKYGSLDCWTTTTDVFAYGLSSSMIEYCQVLIQLGQLTNYQVCSFLSERCGVVHQHCLSKVSWYNLSRDLLVKELNGYNLNPDVRQAKKGDMRKVVVRLLNTVNPSCEASFFCPTRCFLVFPIFNVVVDGLISWTSVSLV